MDLMSSNSRTRILGGKLETTVAFSSSSFFIRKTSLFVALYLRQKWVTVSLLACRSRGFRVLQRCLKQKFCLFNAMVASKNSFGIGDLVFAKVKGYPAWPAKVGSKGYTPWLAPSKKMPEALDVKEFY